MRETRIILLLTAVILAVLCGAIAAGWIASQQSSASTILLGSNVTADERISVEQIDHADWDRLLKRYVDDQGYVDYRAWTSSPADQMALDEYLEHLAHATFPADGAQAETLAYWINAYNAVTIKGILQEYPTSSIRNHTAAVYGYNIWKDLKLNVDGSAYSLEAIEHEILRRMGEPRIHFAIVCASIGCPRLLNEAYVPEDLERQLSENSQAFFADPTKFQVDIFSGTIQVSPILKWFAADFGATVADQMKTIAPFVPVSARPLTESGSARVQYLDYDWGLNDRALRGQTGRR